MTEDSLCAGTNTATRGREDFADGSDRAGSQASNTWTNSTPTGRTMRINSPLNSQLNKVIMLAP